LIVEKAPAKLNLALHVRAMRADGYHELETLFAFVEVGDEIRAERAETTSLTVVGPFAAALEGHENLVMAALEAFTASFESRRGYAITLDKRLPIASGMGGGSADAAATLRALSRFHGIALDNPTLQLCAASVGSDVPACLLGVTAIGRGRGEQLEPIDGAPGVPVLLVNPGVAVSTAQVFARWDGIDRGPLPEGRIGAIVHDGRNDLEPAARDLAPEIDEVLEVLANQPGALLARMSGSGATCFALFERAEDCAAAAARLAQPGWWVCETALA
jgi:4-diphosphocytidyl-2-C-methyl-D-erythritol kinase